MPRPGEDRSDVGGAAQFNNIGPVPLPVPRHLWPEAEGDIVVTAIDVRFPPHARPVPVKVGLVEAGSGSGLLTRRPLRPRVSQFPTVGTSRGDLSRQRKHLENAPDA